MTSPVPALEAIEMVARSLALEIYQTAVDSDDGSHSMAMPVAVELIIDAIAPLARKTEALQRENAELREALDAVFDDTQARTKAGMTYGINGHPTLSPATLNIVAQARFADRRARALLGGHENAGN